MDVAKRVMVQAHHNTCEEEDVLDDQENQENIPTEPGRTAPVPTADHDPNGRMPGTLSTATKALQSDCHSI